MIIPLLLLGCGPSSSVGPIGDSSEARSSLTESARLGPVRAEVLGDPFGLDPVRQEKLVTAGIADGVDGVAVEFTTDATRASAREPHLVVVLNPVTEPLGKMLCEAPERIRTATFRGTLIVFAALCDGEDLVNAVHGDTDAAGPTDQRVKRLYWQLGGLLFPDDYADTYGAEIIPGVRIGIEGSFGF